MGQSGGEGGRLNWAVSKTMGGVSEIAVLSPIKRGCIPNERRTYEERLRSVIAELADRQRRHVPIDLQRIPAIHFGRLTILRPEQYLVGSSVRDVRYFDKLLPSEDGAPPAPQGADMTASEPSPATDGTATPGDNPRPFDEFTVMARPSSPLVPPPASRFNSFLLTQVEFDGDLRVYMRDIAEYLAGVFDLIFNNCEDFPGTCDFEKFWLWVRRYQINTDLLYTPYPGLSVTRIKYLEAFKARFDDFAAKARPAPGARAPNLDDLFDAFLHGNQQFSAGFPTPGGAYRPL